MTTNDERDTLEVLKAELDFIEKGGYGRSVRTPRQPTSIFQDSLTCLNFADSRRPHPCDECLLIDFVPPENRNEKVPCHHIALNGGGVTVSALDWKDDQSNTEEALKNWLRQKIRQMEQQRLAGTV